jgi:hypothetical protein
MENIIFTDLIEDILKMSDMENANYRGLIKSAFVRGFKEGKEFAKKKSIEAIQGEYNHRSNKEII